MGLLDKVKSVLSSKAAAEAARHEAMAAYWSAMRRVNEALMSYKGGVQTRVDTPWHDADAIGVNGFPSYGDSYRQMRNRARVLEMNNVLAAATLDRAVENVIGAQIRVRPTTSSQEFNRQARDYIREITSGTRMDVRRRLSWGAMQRMVYRAMLRDGDVGIVMVDDDGEPRLQIIEGHLIESPPATGNRRIVDGVELNNVGRAVAYWIRSDQPNGQSRHQRVDARDFIFLARSVRANSVRGEPAFHGSYTLFDQIVGYLDATVIAARIAACQAMVSVRSRPDDDYDAQPEDVEDMDGQSARSMPIEPGMINVVDAASGEDLKGFNPTQPTQQFPDAIRTFARFVGLKFGLTVESVLLDFSQANFSVSKAARNQANITAWQNQEEFHAEFIARWYAWVISKGVKAGRITAPEPDDAWSHEWIPSGKPMVEPHREVAAVEKLLQLGVETESNVAMELGYDYDELQKQRAEDRRIREQYQNGADPGDEPGDEPGIEDDDDPPAAQNTPRAWRRFTANRVRNL